MTKTRWIWTLVIVGLVAVAGGLVGTKAAQFGVMMAAGKSFAPPPESVATAKVEATEWQATRAAIGSLVAVHSVTISSELTGTVRALHFDSSSTVRRGEVLLRLDTSVEEANLAAAEAEAALARQTLERAQRLRQTETNTPADLDGAQARAAQAEAQVAALRATIAKKTLHAPFDGRVGVRLVEVGQVLASGTPLTTLQSIDPVYAEFWLPQQTLGELRRGLAVRLTSDAFPSREWLGQIAQINPEVDVATRNVRVRALVQNRDGTLLPGMFANVDVLSPDKRPVLIIPATSVLYAPYGDSVYTVVEKKDEAGKAQLVAQQKFVRLGDRRGDLVAVATGLSAGELVVTAGAFKLRNGMAVVEKNALAPDAQVNPKPIER